MGNTEDSLHAQPPHDVRLSKQSDQLANPPVFLFDYLAANVAIGPQVRYRVIFIDQGQEDLRRRLSVLYRSDAPGMKVAKAMDFLSRISLQMNSLKILQEAAKRTSRLMQEFFD